MPTDTTDEEEPTPTTADETALLSGVPLEFADPPTATLESVIGLDEQVETLRVAVVDPLVDIDRSARTHGTLVYGPSGTGKSYVSGALVGELARFGFTVLSLDSDFGLGDAAETMAEVETVLRELAPCVVLADPLRNPTHGGRVEAVKSMLGSLNADHAQVLLVAAFSTDEVPYDTSTAFESFEVKVEVDAPDAGRRRGLVEHFLGDLCGPDAVGGDGASDLAHLVHATRDFTAVQLRTVCERALHLSLADDVGAVSNCHLEAAISAVDRERTIGEPRHGGRFRVTQPEVPAVTFDDIGGQDEAKCLLQEFLEFPARYGHLYDAFDIRRSRGVLLYGPPGNGKTMLAKAVATEGDRAFFAVSGPELKAPYVGQTERRIRRLFAAAREHAPSVVFFDEFDAIAPARSGVGRATYKIDFVNQLLAELDGVQADADVLVIAATNRKDAIDDAVLRPGRLGEHVEVSPPGHEGRRAIVGSTVADYPLAADVDIDWIAESIPADVSGAVLVGVCEKALHFAIRDASDEGCTSPDAIAITRENVEAATEGVVEDGDDGTIGFV